VPAVPLVSFNPGVELVLEAYEPYWRKSPSVKRLVLKAVPDETTRLAMLKRARPTSSTCSRASWPRKRDGRPG